MQADNQVFAAFITYRLQLAHVESTYCPCLSVKVSARPPRDMSGAADCPTLRLW